MSDTIYKWARREVLAIELNGQPLNRRHLIAVAREALALADEIEEAMWEQIWGNNA